MIGKWIAVKQQCSKIVCIFIFIYANLNFITNFNIFKSFWFTCDRLKYHDCMRLKESTRKYFKQFKRVKDSLICSDIIPAVHPQSSEEHKSE